MGIMERTHSTDPSVIGKSFCQSSISTECIISQDSVADVENSPVGSVEQVSDKYTVYKSRWLMLFIFTLYSATNVVHWTQYTIIENIIEKYYNVSSLWIELTAIVFYIVYIPLLIPACWIMDRMGLRFGIICGALLNCVGSWIKIVSWQPHQFYIGFIGQTIVAIANIFVLSLPSRVAAVWFGPNQVSTACGIGVFGNQLGIAVGFVLPSIIVKNHDDLALIGEDLKFMFLIVACWTTAILLLVLIFFKNAPETPPSAAQARALNKDQSEPSPFYNSLKRLVQNKNFDMLLLTYGLNIGVFYALATLWNPIILKYYPGHEEDVGRIGLGFTVAGVAGAILSGFILDKTHRYKETCLAIYAVNVLTMLLFTFTLSMGLSVVYVTTMIMGFCMAGYLSVGFEFGAELTYPEAEATSSGLLNVSVQIWGILFTLLYSFLFDERGDVFANCALIAVLILGTFITAFTKSDLRRQAAQNS